MSEEPPDAGLRSEAGGALRRLALFLLIAGAGVALSHFTKLGEYFDAHSIADLAGRMGANGALVIFAAGALTPLMFLPRWPIAFLAGLLYGVGWGTALATVASTLGAWLHFVLSRTLLAPMSEKIKRRFHWEHLDIPRDKQFMVLFLLRAFPLSSFVATNILAGALKVSRSRYLTATFLGMIPSTVMYAAWGKLMKKPDSQFYGVAALAVVLIVVGSVLAHRYIAPWLKPRVAKSDAE
ncbi:MAG: VTT domain-containing protein [Kiritimatiellae bacterium]|nr:VTT domain-containing protein [Kiritimatiellia bacterium]